MTTSSLARSAARHLVLLVCGAALLSSAPSIAFGHAARTSLTTTTFLWLSPSASGLDGLYSVAFGDIPAHGLRREMDRNSNDHVEESEQAAFVETLRQELSRCLSLRSEQGELRIEMSHRATRLEDRLIVPEWVRIEFHLTSELPIGSTVEVSDRCDFAARGEAEVRLEPALGVSLSNVRPEANSSADVLAYTFRSGQPPPITFRVHESTTERPQRSSSEPELSVPPSNELARLLGDSELISFWALCLAFLLGSLHALSPGHGKTLVAAYLVGEQGTLWQAVLLGLVVTLSHVISVVVLGFLALWASESLMPASLSKLLSVISGMIITLLGAGMFRSRWLQRSGGKTSHDHGHDHQHDHEHPHTHRSPDTSVHHHGGGHHHHGGGHHHHGSHRGLLGVLTLGISGGMVPCPSALVVLLLAVSIGRILEGMLLIGAFSLGLASVLVVLGVLVVRARKLLDSFSASRNVLKVLPLVSAAVVTVIGSVVILQALITS